MNPNSASGVGLVQHVFTGENVEPAGASRLKHSAVAQGSTGSDFTTLAQSKSVPFRGTVPSW
jgi:hypothetical protein